MSETWYVLIIVVAVAAAFLALRARRSAEQDRRSRLAESNPGSRDDALQREIDRTRNMSDSDQVWQAASLQRHRDNQARKQSEAEKP